MLVVISSASIAIIWFGRINSSPYFHKILIYLGHTGPVLCPQCNREGVEAEGATIDADRFPDKAIKRLLGKQKVVCANPGCPWKGILVEFPSHEDACPMASVTCPHCGCEVELPRYIYA